MGLYSPWLYLLGTLNYHTAAYLMRDDVKAALHVNNLGVGPSSWPGPAPGWSYTSSYDACNQGAITVDKSMVDFYRELAPALRGKIVSGQKGCCCGSLACTVAAEHRSTPGNAAVASLGAAVSARLDRHSASRTSGGSPTRWSPPIRDSLTTDHA